MIYRAMRSLDTGKRIIPAGAVFSSAEIKAGPLAKLEELGKVAPALLPPIIAMPPPWKQYATKLKRIDITDAGEWMEADPALVASALSVSKGKANDFRAQLYTMFSDPRRRG